MALQRRLMQPFYSRVLTGPATRRLWRTTHEWLERLGRKPPALHCRLRLDDPDSYLLVQLLPDLLDHYPLSLEFSLLPAGRELPAHALADAWLQAQRLQLDFHSLTPPAPEDCRLTERILMAATHLPEPDRLILMRQLLACVWNRQHGKLETLALRFPPLDPDNALDTLRAWSAADVGGDGATVVRFRGEEFLAPDELPELISLLEDSGLNRLDHCPAVAAPYRPDHGFLVTDSDQLTRIRAHRYRLDFYFCFCDPYSYLEFDGLLRLADHYSLRLSLQPVLLPRSEAVAALTLPPAGLLWRSARHAGLRDQDYGDICLPDAHGLRHCHALMAFAARHGMERRMAECLLAGIWTQGRDMSYKPHLRAMLREAGFRRESLEAALAANGADAIGDTHRRWRALGATAMPCLVLDTGRQRLLGGKDRLWALDMLLADTLNNNNSE